MHGVTGIFWKVTLEAVYSGGGFGAREKGAGGTARGVYWRGLCSTPAPRAKDQTPPAKVLLRDTERSRAVPVSLISEIAGICYVEISR